MKRLTFKKVILLGSLVLLSVASLGIGVTLAAYWQKRSVTQQVGYQGEMTTFPFFLDTDYSNPTKTWETNDAIFYVYAFKSTDAGTYDWISETKTINSVVISEATYKLHVFRIDVSKYDRFNFVRFNPNGPSVPSWNRDDNSLWDQTSMQTYSASTNYYKIDTSDRVPNGDGYGHATARVVGTGQLTESNGNLVWA